MDIQDGIVPEHIIQIGKKMISLDSQIKYQKSTRTNGCVPQGIAKQSKCRFSGNNTHIQAEIQHIFDNAASRTLDIVIKDTESRLSSARNIFYSSMNTLRETCEAMEVQQDPLIDKVNAVLAREKNLASSRHNKKPIRDKSLHKIYIPDTTHQPINRKPQDIRQSKKRRFRLNQNRVKPFPKKQKCRQPMFKKRRKTLKSQQIVSIPPSVNPNIYFHNLTELQLNEHHKFIFYLGPKFCPTPLKANLEQFETSIDNWAYLLRYTVIYSTKTPEDPDTSNTSKDHSIEKSLVKKKNYSPIASSGHPALELFIQKVKEDLLVHNKATKKVGTNLSKEHQKALKDLRNLEDIIIRPYDKGQGFFLDYKENYRQRVLKELESDLYERVDDKEAITQEVTQGIKDWAEKWIEQEKFLTKKLINWIIPSPNTQPGKIYLNYKKHKPEKNFPGRLITSGCGSFTENISDLIGAELKEVAFKLPYVLKDTNQLLRKIEQVNKSGSLIGKSIIHTSWDVVAMFPNIPKDMGTKRCREKLNERTDPKLSTECIMEALDLSLNYNIAQFDDTWYRQTRGAAMGPHDSCPYADIAMSEIDNAVHSDANPHRKPDNWSRYREDIYDTWLGTEKELLAFTDWLNTISPSIKFTVAYAKDGIEFLDTFIYDKEGTLHTRIFSKESDTHAYLPPSSCHPYHICRNNPSQIARRVKKLSSENEEYEKAKQTFSDHLKVRGYSQQSVEEAFEKFETVERTTLFTEKTKDNTSTRCFPLVTEFNPHLPAVAPVLNKHKHILLEDPKISSIIPPDSIFASFSQPKSIHDLLVSSKFSSGLTPKMNMNGKCVKCNNCVLCNHLLVETSTFSGFHTDKKYGIKEELMCTTEGVIYLLNDLICRKSYVGSTIGNMRTRAANYRNHIKTQHKGCEIATHFSQLPDAHSLPALTAQGSSMITKKEQQELFNNNLSEQIEFILIDRVAFPDNSTSTEKRSLIEKSEGYWQTQLRTMKKYGGLNVRDERKLKNNKDAKNCKTVPPQDPQSNQNSVDPTQKTKPPNSKAPVLNPQPKSAEPESIPIRRSNRVKKKPPACTICD